MNTFDHLLTNAYTNGQKSDFHNLFEKILELQSPDIVFEKINRHLYYIDDEQAAKIMKWKQYYENKLIPTRWKLKVILRQIQVEKEKYPDDGYLELHEKVYSIINQRLEIIKKNQEDNPEYGKIAFTFERGFWEEPYYFIVDITEDFDYSKIFNDLRKKYEKFKKLQKVEEAKKDEKDEKTKE
jgi:hypothetical protein